MDYLEFRMNINERNLEDWVKHNLITNEQAHNILVYENSHDHQKSSFAVFGFAALGIVIIAMGLIAIIASHWYQIPDAIKIAADYIFLGTLGGACYHYRKADRPLLFEGLLLGFIFSILASIALIGQIFQLSGFIPDTLLFWTLITLPVALFSGTFMTPFIWVSVFVPSVLAEMVHFIFQTYGFVECAYIAAFTMVPIVCGLIATGMRFIKFKTVYWHQSFVFWTMITGFVIVFTADVNTMLESICKNEFYILPALILTVISVTCVHATDMFSNFQKTLVTILLVIYMLFMHFAFFSDPIELLGAAFSIVILALAAVYCASCQYRKLFHFFTFLIAVRFFYVYLRHIHGLASTGLGLIISGGLIIFLVVMWNRYSKVLLERITEMSK
jgi:uncharacterized membrane protein